MADNESPFQNLRTKLARIRQEITHISKKGKAPDAIGGYAYMKAEDICGDIGDAMALMHVSMMPVKVEVIAHDLMGSRLHVLLLVTYRFIDGDSDETIEVQAVGQGIDGGDKASNKAMTGAKKYALSQALTLRIGDDSEADDTKLDGGKGPAPTQATRPAPAGGTPAPASIKSGPTISQKQRNRMFAIAGGNTDLIRTVQAKWGYARSDEVTMKDYDAICTAITNAAKGGTEPVTTEEDINW